MTGSTGTDTAQSYSRVGQSLQSSLGFVSGVFFPRGGSSTPRLGGGWDLGSGKV